jgi:hypothetical protein
MTAIEKRYNQLSLFDKYCFNLIMNYPTLYRTKLEVMKEVFVDRNLDPKYKEYLDNADNYYRLLYFAEKSDVNSNQEKERINQIFDFTKNGLYEKKNLKKYILSAIKPKRIPRVVRENIFYLIDGIDNDKQKIKELDIVYFHEKEDSELFTKTKKDFKKEQEERQKRFFDKLLNDDITLFNYFIDLDSSFIEAREQYIKHLIADSYTEEISFQLHERNRQSLIDLSEQKNHSKIMIQFHDNDFWSTLTKVGETLLTNENFLYSQSHKLKKEDVLKIVNFLFPSLYTLEYINTDQKEWDYQEYLQITDTTRILFGDEITEEILKEGDNGESIILDLKKQVVYSI